MSSTHHWLKELNMFLIDAVGWGGFHLGYSNNTDPEPGRCRRTDGKKWRCSRDAVVDQKYCERHMNRGRHRSRKPVEGQSGQALTTGGTTNTATTTTSTITPSGSSKQINSAAASPSSSIVVPGGNTVSNTLSFAHQEHSKNMNSLIGQDNGSSAANTINRSENYCFTVIVYLLNFVKINFLEKEKYPIVLIRVSQGFFKACDYDLSRDIMYFTLL